MFFYLAGLLLVQQAGSSTWEFGGHDDPSYEVLDQKTGRIKPFEYEKNIVFNIPKCKEIKFVQAEVKNKANDPTVSFKIGDSSVPIKYKPMQATISHYDIIAKGSHKKGCVEETTTKTNLRQRIEELWTVPGKGPKKPWLNGAIKRDTWG